jgi:hypothetical protein
VTRIALLSGSQTPFGIGNVRAKLAEPKLGGAGGERVDDSVEGHLPLFAAA